MQFSFTIGDLSILVAGLAFILGMSSSIKALKEEVKRLHGAINNLLQSHIAPLNTLAIKHQEKLEYLEDRVNSLEVSVFGKAAASLEQRKKDAEKVKKLREEKN